MINIYWMSKIDMTVKGLNKFLRNIGVPVIGRPKKINNTIPFYLNQLRGKTLAIDTSMIIYAMNYRAAEDMVERHEFKIVDGKWDAPDTTAIYPYFQRRMVEYIQCIQRSGIIPIYVMDGKTPPMKEAVHMKRREERDSMKEEYSDDIVEHKRKVVHYFHPEQNHHDLTIQLLKEMECKVLQAEYEAEGVCSYLALNRHCHGILCDDGDAIMYGCPIILRKPRMFNHMTGHMEVEGVAIVDILLSLGFLVSPFSPEQYDLAIKRLQLMCILSGTDYHNGVYKMASCKVHSLMMKHDIHTYEKMCEVDERFKVVPYYEILATLEANTKYTVL